MSSNRVENLTKDLEELKRLVSLASRQLVKDLLLSNVLLLENDIKDAKMLQIATPPEASTAQPAKTSGPKRYEVELTQYAFDQSDKFVKLFVTLDGVEKCAEENVLAAFTENSFVLTIKDLNNRDYRLQIKNLLETIDVAKSYRKIKQGMVVIFAKKLKEGSHWSHLTLIEKRLKTMKEAEMDIDKDNKDPSAGLMKIMQKMYNSGDSEMKQMIGKAWTEGEEKRLQDLKNQ